jgi:hypothetical protein
LVARTDTRESKEAVMRSGRGAAVRCRVRKPQNVDGHVSWSFEVPYRDPVTNALRTFGKHGFATRKAAEEALNAALVCYQQGEPMAIDRSLTIGKLLHDWLEVVEPNVSKGTTKARRNHIARARRAMRHPTALRRHD